MTPKLPGIFSWMYVLSFFLPFVISGEQQRNTVIPENSRGTQLFRRTAEEHSPMYGNYYILIQERTKSFLKYKMLKTHATGVVTDDCNHIGDGAHPRKYVL